MKNLEIKARVNNVKVLKKQCKQLGAKFIRTEHQVDTYFNVLQGRLKLRVLGRQRGELIYYVRREKTNRRWSNYFVFPVSDPKALNQLLSTALGVKVVVDKTRTHYQYRNARIFLDRVSGPGQYMEIEVVVQRGMLQAKWLMAELLKYFQIPEKIFIKRSYSDLVLAK